MLWRCSLVLNLLLTSFVSGLYVLPEAQNVLHAESLAGEPVLKSFKVQPAQGWGINDLLRVAELENADVWHISPSRMDVYFPSLHDYQTSILSTANLSEATKPISMSSLRPSSLSSGSWDLSSLSNTTFHLDYHPLHEVQRFMEELASQYSETVQLVNIGHSAEQREMYAMKISQDTHLQSSSHQAKAKKGVVVTGAMHAREWVAMSTALYLAHALVARESEPHAMSSLLDNHDFYIIPMPNPDGYVYTWERDRLWYKNRQIVGPYEKCIGIDLQRNFGYKWKAKARFPASALDVNEDVDIAKSGGTVDPCSHWYPGHRAFEAPEVNNIANFVTTLPALELYIDLRAYGQMLSTPYSFSCKKTPKDAENQIEAAHGAAKAIKLVHGTTFTTGSLCEMLYKAPGNIVDWMYARAGITYSYSVHLRDTGTYGFSLPSEWIRPVGEETASMVQFLSEFLAKRF